MIQPGEQIPLLLGSASKTLVAYMPQEGAGADRRGDRTMPPSEHRPKCVRSSKSFGSKGYAVSHGERLLGVSAVSAPIKDVNEEVHYCLSIGGPSVRVQSHEKEFIKLAVSAAADISRQFGGESSFWVLESEE